MDDRQFAAMTDEALERDIVRGLAVDPSPEFLARVRMRIASEPAPGMWRSASALRPWAIAAAAIAAVAIGVVLMRPIQSTAPLAARAIGGQTIGLPYVGSGFSRTYNDQTVHASLRAVGPPTGGPHVLPDTILGAVTNPAPLLDPRETQALRSLIAGVRNNRVDLSPLLRPGVPAPMELAPVGDLVIAPIAIEPLAPQGAQGERQ